MQLFNGGRPLLLLFLTISLSTLTTTTTAHNITAILSHFPEFSTFNHYLTITHLAPIINSRQTITVCALDNSAISPLLHLPISTIKNTLSLHILLDYFGAKKLHQITDGTALAATLYQATGSAPGTAGFVNITDLKGGKVAFGAQDSGTLDSSFVKSVKEIPYNISVIQISHVINSPDAMAPAPAPETANITAIMSAHGCKVFSGTLSANPDAFTTYMNNIEGGLTVFCPMDDAFKGFLPKFKNLTSDGKSSLLLYHGLPIYESIPMLKSSNGDMNTLATDGKRKFQFTVQNDGDEVTLKTKIDTAKITGTLIDEQPLAIYTIDKVLRPSELFKGEIAPTPAPAPAPAKAKAPKSSKKHPHHASPPAPPRDVEAADSPADSPADGPDADSTADNESSHGGRREIVMSWSLVMGSLWAIIMLML